MIRRIIFARHSVAAIVTGLTLALAAPVLAEDAMMTPDEVIKDVETTFGGVPTFVTKIAKSALPGFWTLEKGLELSETTALDAKTKALISLAVASQIPCQYCVWADTNALKQLGAHRRGDRRSRCNGRPHPLRQRAVLRPPGRYGAVPQGLGRRPVATSTTGRSC